MDYYYDADDHDEDDLPEISLPMSNHTRDSSHEQDDHHSNKSLENWRSLYETSIQSLRSDEDDQRSIPQKSFYLEQQTSIEPPPSERPDSPISEVDSTINKSKWEIRLPELLNSMVGPDRQKREISRRHTTNIVFQQSPESPSPHALEPNVNQPINPLVQKLRQKFDGMSTNNSTPKDPKNHFHIPKYQRLGSLTCRGLTNNTGERSIQRSRPALPIRATPEITSIKSRSGSIGSNRTTLTNHRTKPGPPISYPKHYYPPPSTTSVVKQLINGSATLVYDSTTQKSSMKTKPSLIKHPKDLEQTREDLMNTNALLTGRQLLPEHQKNKKNQNEQSNGNSSHSTITSNSTRRRRNSMDIPSNEHEPSFVVYEKTMK